MKLTTYILPVLALGAYAAPAAIDGVSQLTGGTSRVMIYLLTLVVSCRVDPWLSRLVGQQTPLRLLLRRHRRRAVRLHRRGQQRIVILQRGTLKGALHREVVIGRAMGGPTEGTMGLGTGRAALRRRRPTVEMKSRSSSEGIKDGGRCVRDSRFWETHSAA